MKNYYLLNNGRLKRESNSLVMEGADGKKRQIPVEDVDSLLVYGEVDFNSRVLTFLGSKKIPFHLFNYYGFYSGSYYPREYLHSGHLLVHQVAHYTDAPRRLKLVRELVRASAHSMLRNVAYYANRRKATGDSEIEETEPLGEIGGEPSGSAMPTDDALEAALDATISQPSESSNANPKGGHKGDHNEGSIETSIETSIANTETANTETANSDTGASALDPADPFESLIEFETEVAPLAQIRDTITRLAAQIETFDQVNHLRGIEGKMRERYYQAWQHIIGNGWAFDRRTRRPPDNEVNALISFGNAVLYTACLSEIYRTQLTPTISYLHEPGARRFSLALDVSEIFKPLLVDRAIFRLLNTNQLKPEHFDRSLECCYLNDAGKKLFLVALEERLNATIKHRRLGRHVSYRHLIRLECYKLIRHLTDVEPYHAFRAWW